MSPNKVFLDTSILKSAVRIKQYGRMTDLRNSNGKLVGRQVPIIQRNYNDDLPDPHYRKECNLVNNVAVLVQEGLLEAVTSPEALMEFSQLPKTFPLDGGVFHGAHYDLVHSPVKLGYSFTSPKEDLRNAIESISDSRFIEVRRQVGAFQGNKKVPINQLFDALFLWTAECAGCKYLLTVERKLPQYKFKSDTLICLRPSTLLQKIERRASEI